MGAKKIRPIRIDGNVAYVTLTKGYEAIIDAGDVPLVEGFNWSAARNRYAMLCTGSGDSRFVTMMHRLILGATKGFEVDHIDGNGFNNRRANLRIATTAQNQWNVGPNALNTSGRKGVSFDRTRQKWIASIRFSGGRKQLGRFDTLEQAAEAYEAAAIALHGDFART